MQKMSVEQLYSHVDALRQFTLHPQRRSRATKYGAYTSSPGFPTRHLQNNSQPLVQLDSLPPPYPYRRPIYVLPKLESWPPTQQNRLNAQHRAHQATAKKEENKPADDDDEKYSTSQKPSRRLPHTMQVMPRSVAHVPGFPNFWSSGECLRQERDNGYIKDGGPDEKRDSIGVAVQ